MDNVIFGALLSNCAKFQEHVNLQMNGCIDPKEAFFWNSLLVNSGHPETAIEFVKLNVNYSQCEIDDLDKFIRESEAKSVKPTRCTTFGCSEEQIEKCHKKLVTNSNGEPSNSPAYFIREDNLKKYELLEEFNNLKELVFEKIIAGDMSAHLDENFIKAVAKLKAEDSLAFNRLKDELSQMKVKLTAFTDEVSKLSKSVTKQKNVDVVQVGELPDNLKPYSNGLDQTSTYVNESGYIMLIIPTVEDEIHMQASNFVARIVEVQEFDDGIDIIRNFVLDGILEGKKVLPSITVSAKEFRSMNWVLSQWGNVLITSAPKARDIVREVIQKVSFDAPTTKVHYTLGWKKINDTWHYLYSGGAIGGENICVAEISELKGYFFKEHSYSALDCAAYVQKFIDIAPHEITIPLLAHTFLSILIEKLKEEEIEPRYLIWVYGVSGSFKTALNVVLMNFFGTFNSPPATFNDTVTALEKKAYLTKDSLLLVDDFHPSASPQEAKSKAGVANALTRKYGDRITKSRSKSNLTLAKDYPPRGNLICTSEDLLIGHSTNSRHMGIAVNRGDINSNILTCLQNNKQYLSGFMQYFIEYVAENIMNNSSITFKDKFQSYRDKSQNSNHHKRFAEAIACLQIGLEVFLDFLKHIGHIDEASYTAYFDEGFSIFQNLAKRQNDLVQNDDVADKFMSALKELIDTKQIVPQNKNLPVTLNKGTVVCYEDEANYYFIPQTTYAIVADFFVRRGDLLNINEYMLRKMLADKRYLVESSDGDGHKTTKIKVGISTIRVLQISKNVINTF